ncbi:nuclear transport factor 2 family protein [Rhodococcus erythropolis]|uniref:nuclear transport factor 2 family protein n=1 Tax=Rhodococcus erythropolis TaxID=1833 RepID=UPI002225B76F|nr:nuclear transport factor 2 family protein [Rhodococcus erythropolis]MCW2295377.1 3-phenylpropionate/cinnamic acid dioxygenase small subunit [Rhodococcus erythropolis]
MTDYEQIRQLFARYNQTVDIGDVENWIACWVEDGVLRRSNAEAAVHGHEQLRQAAVNPPAPGMHVSSDHIIAIDGNQATATSYLLYLDRTRSFSVHFFGIYRDQITRTTEGWKFKKRILEVIDS